MPLTQPLPSPPPSGGSGLHNHHHHHHHPYHQGTQQKRRSPRSSGSGNRNRSQRSGSKSQAFLFGIGLLLGIAYTRHFVWMVRNAPEPSRSHPLMEKPNSYPMFRDNEDEQETLEENERASVNSIPTDHANALLRSSSSTATKTKMTTKTDQVSKDNHSKRKKGTDGNDDKADDDDVNEENEAEALMDEKHHGPEVAPNVSAHKGKSADGNKRGQDTGGGGGSKEAHGKGEIHGLEDEGGNIGQRRSVELSGAEGQSESITKRDQLEGTNTTKPAR